MMEKSAHIIRCLVAGLLFANLAAGACPSEFVELNSACFKFVQEPKSYSAAEEECEASRATLADLASDNEMTALLNYVNANFPGTFWTSGRFKNERYEWANTQQQVPQRMRGRRFRNTSDMCAYVCSRTNRLWDSRCSTPKRFICKLNVELDVSGVEAF